MKEVKESKTEAKKPTYKITAIKTHTAGVFAGSSQTIEAKRHHVTMEDLGNSVLCKDEKTGKVCKVTYANITHIYMEEDKA